MARRRSRHNNLPRRGLRLWIVPMALLGGIALLGFIGIYLLDDLVTGGPQATDEASGIGRYLRLDPDHISDAVTGLTGVTVAVLAIVITVVSLLVQLTSERYTGVASMFLRDRTNVGIMAYYVISSVFGLATSLSLTMHNKFIPDGLYNNALIGAEQPGYAVTLSNSANTNHVASSFYTDLSGQFKIKGDTLAVYAAINNVFDREPPTAPSVAGNGNFILFDPIGRSYKVGMRAKF